MTVYELVDGKWVRQDRMQFKTDSQFDTASDYYKSVKSRPGWTATWNAPGWDRPKITIPAGRWSDPGSGTYNPPAGPASGGPPQGSKRIGYDDNAPKARTKLEPKTKSAPRATEGDFRRAVAAFNNTVSGFRRDRASYLEAVAAVGKDLNAFNADLVAFNKAADQHNALPKKQQLQSAADQLNRQRSKLIAAEAEIRRRKAELDKRQNDLEKREAEIDKRRAELDKMQAALTPK